VRFTIVYNLKRYYKLHYLYTFIYPVYWCINYTRPNYAFSKFFLIDREKQDKLLFISRSIFNQIQPHFNQLFLSRWEMHSKNFVWICLVFLELSCSQTNTHTHTNPDDYIHNLLAEVIIKYVEISNAPQNYCWKSWNRYCLIISQIVIALVCIVFDFDIKYTPK
jgi:hypothetical protein